MELDEADSIEELAEMALIHLQDLGGDSLLIVHGDEGHAHPVTQVFYGLDYSQIETELWEWSSHDWAKVPVQVKRSGSGLALTAALLDRAGDCLGWLHMRSKKHFPAHAQSELAKFAASYLERLLEICLLRARPFEIEPQEVVQSRSSLILSRLELEDSEDSGESFESIERAESFPDEETPTIILDRGPAPESEAEEVDSLELQLIRISEWQFDVDSEWIDLQDYILRDSAI